MRSRHRRWATVAVAVVTSAGVLAGTTSSEARQQRKYFVKGSLGVTPTAAKSGAPEFATFSEVGTLAGVTASHHSEGFGSGIGYLVTGQAWGDYDQDGWPDLYVTDHRGANTLYHNEGDGTFAISPLSRRVSLEGAVSGGAIFADYDNDGWPDLYVANNGPDVLFHNDRGRGFTDVTKKAGLTDGGRGISASWADYDEDGYLDLYVTNYGACQCSAPTAAQGHPDRLFHNEGDGTFKDVTGALDEPSTRGFGMVASWLDYDNDRDLDLYLVNDVLGTRYLPGNALFRNDGHGCGGWCFVDVSKSSGAGLRVDGMGLAIGDYDDDRDLDLFITNTGWAVTPLTGPSVLLQNNGDGSFDEVAQDAGVDIDAVAWGAVFLDHDNDGHQDLYVGLGRAYPDLGPASSLNRLLRNRGDGTFDDATASGGASLPVDTFGVASADYNNDGWPDLITGSLDAGYHLFANAGTAGQGHHRLAIRLRGGGPVNRDAVGTRLYLVTSAGQTQMREVTAGSSLGAGGDLTQGFGLGTQTVRSLRVVWPNGRTQAFDDVRSDALGQLTYGKKPSFSPLTDVTVPRRPVVPLPSNDVRLGGLVVPGIALFASALLLAWLAAVLRERRRLAQDLMLVVVLGGLSFQVGHMLEHALQAAHWTEHPGEQPWITPWGVVATDGFAALAGNHRGRATGTELLHLLGNWIFFAGLIAMYGAMCRAGVPGKAMRATRLAFWIELFHMVEHLSLTSTYLAFGTPIGTSTLFGFSFDLQGGWASGIRLWWHFLVNLAATTAALAGLLELRRAGLLRPSRGRPAAYERTREVPQTG
jgi:hypothetical protein